MTGPKRLGDFEIVDEIGRGGFGIVYRAHQTSLDRPVAVKVLFRHLIHTQEQITRFEREARAAARLDHSAIVSVYAWGTDGEDFFIAQRLVGHGRTLADEVKDVRAAGSAPKGWFRRIAGLLAQIADGLHQAHERGIVHRDVKPSNILLDESDQPCLSDFGLAKVEDGLELSRTGEFVGSPYYMSPEQADTRRGEVDERSDIYSLGVTLYELLTLTQPFHGTTAHEIVRSILTEEPRRPSRVEERVPIDLETICLHAMEKEPERRYQSAAEFAADLRAFLDGEPIAAVPIGTVRRMIRGVRRHRERLVAGALGVVIVGGGLWIFSLQQSTRSLERQAEATVQEATIHAGIQARRSDDLQQIGDDYTRKIQDAAQRNASDEVQELVADQQRATQSVNENYKWLADQLQSLGDTEAVVQVGSGVATGGLVGGLQSLSEVLSSKPAAAAEGDEAAQTLRQRLAAEVAARMNSAYGLLKQAPATATATHEPSPAPAQGVELPLPAASAPAAPLPDAGQNLGSGSGSDTESPATEPTTDAPPMPPSAALSRAGVSFSRAASLVLRIRP